MLYRRSLGTFPRGPQGETGIKKKGQINMHLEQKDGFHLLQPSKLKSCCLCYTNPPWRYTPARRTASASRDSAAALACLHHCCSHPSSTFQSTFNLGGNLPPSAPLSSKLLDLSIEIRDTAQSQFSQLVARPRHPMFRLCQRPNGSSAHKLHGGWDLVQEAPGAELTSSAVSFSIRTILFSQ